MRRIFVAAKSIAYLHHTVLDHIVVCGILILFQDAANDPIQIAVDVMEEIFFFVDAGSFQNLNIQVFAFRVMLLHNLEPNCIQPVVHILYLHGGNAVHIDFGVSHQL